MELNEIVRGIVLDKECSIKPDSDSTESKTLTIKVRFDGVRLRDVFAKAVSSTVISWQNGPGRKRFDQWTNRQVIMVDFKAPGRTVETREDKIARYMSQGMSKEIATFAVDNPEKFAEIVNKSVSVD